jgi:hypothetical protein
MNKQAHGGTRAGAGRKSVDPTVPVTIRLTQEQREVLKRRGVAKWLRPLLDKSD